MGFSLFLLSLLLLLSPVIYAANSCTTSACSNSSFVVQFPFRIQDQQPQNCAYPGFDLTCNKQGIPILNLPQSGEFSVRYINYRTQEIQLYDPSNCLPRRLLDLSLSGTPFTGAYYLNYTFLICPSELTRSRFTVIDCMSNSTTTTLATSSDNLAAAMTMCKVLVNLPIPVSWPRQYDTGFSSQLNGDLLLTWNVPNCEDCEAQGGMCGFENSTSQQVICFNNSGTGRADRLRVFKIISFSIAIPAITTAICIAFFICFIHGRQGHGGTNNTTQQNFDLAAVTPQPSTPISGLDDSTIESYTKVVLGESRRLPGPNDGTCSICLSEYHAKETVRCIPECEHCFHAECIDEWLRMNGTCPVCRNSPSPARVNLQQV
ncbi:putative RING-H2 finger protein ATL21A [Actinidia eriantha]|uniref:putative RING-H2 finger protein ATL21A n=1 Tax=Actinidia eriantha TaxID=165200 RepID=UPI00258ED3B2|nr:putative RING-H2 finger protein ATL21A [Actinidia eriantha]